MLFTYFQINIKRMTKVWKTKETLIVLWELKLWFWKEQMWTTKQASVKIFIIFQIFKNNPNNLPQFWWHRKWNFTWSAESDSESLRCSAILTRVTMQRRGTIVKRSHRRRRGNHPRFLNLSYQLQTPFLMVSVKLVRNATRRMTLQLRHYTAYWLWDHSIGLPEDWVRQVGRWVPSLLGRGHPQHQDGGQTRGWQHPPLDQRLWPLHPLRQRLRGDHQVVSAVESQRMDRPLPLPWRQPQQCLQEVHQHAGDYQVSGGRHWRGARLDDVPSDGEWRIIHPTPGSLTVSRRKSIIVPGKI